MFRNISNVLFILIMFQFQVPANGITGHQSVICVEKILSSDPQLINEKDEEGYTPLHLAVISGNVEIAKVIIARGGDFNAVDNEAHSAAHWATGLERETSTKSSS